MIKAKEFLRRGAGDDAAGFEQDDMGSEQQGFTQIVSDENDGFSEAAGERAKFALKFSACNRIEGAERFIHQQDRRIRGECARDADALALAAGEFSRAAIGKFGGIQSNESQELSYADSGAAAVPFFQRRNQTDILCNGEMGEEAGVLDNVTDAATKADGVPIGGGPALHQDLPLRGHQHSVDQFEEGGLAAAAAAQEDQGFPLRNS